jgi:hypothetical protein
MKGKDLFRKRKQRHEYPSWKKVFYSITYLVFVGE